MFCVGTLGPGFTSKGKEPLRVQGAGLLGVPGALGVDSAQAETQSSGRGSELDCTCRPLPGWGRERRGNESCPRKGKKLFSPCQAGRAMQKDLLVGMQAEIPREASCLTSPTVNSEQGPGSCLPTPKGSTLSSPK